MIDYKVKKENKCSSVSRIRQCLTMYVNEGRTLRHYIYMYLVVIPSCD